MTRAKSNYTESKINTLEMHKRCEFPLESELVTTFEPHALDMISSYGCRGSFKEFELGQRIADIVTYSLKEKYDENMLSSFCKTKVQDLNLLAHLLERPLSIRTLSKRTYSSMDWVQERIERLLRLGLIQQEGPTAFSSKHLGDFLPINVFAFETKLEDWKSAVIQAKYYSRFVDASWVVMPFYHHHNEQLVSECRIAGVGLLLLSKMEIKHSIKPRPSSKNRFYRRFSALRLVRSIGVQAC